MNELKHTEVELKFPLLNPNELVDRLNSIAKSDKQGNFQKDTYYNPAHRNFLSVRPVFEWLRLRESKKGFSLNYKKWHNGGGANVVSCDEFETKVDDIEALKKLFENLNFKELVTVEKNRNMWDYKDTEIAIDDVKGLGNFIELEAKGNFTSIEDAKKHLYSILREIGAKVGEQDFEGYPFLLLKKKGLL
ncbi:MAG: class IV adenylate cyclase [Candidatus Nanoarchaeia archaeon]|nr:class IV adenylate cyclase [Candidatus Nanoarchaeia archaeon]MDD5238877.1 class IV adenylate cyclase [Candidatus Nanoarchaeia archaeon]